MEADVWDATHHVPDGGISRVPPDTAIRRPRPIRHLRIRQSPHYLREDLLVDQPSRERVPRLVHIPLNDHLVCRWATPAFLLLTVFIVPAEQRERGVMRDSPDVALRFGLYGLEELGEDRVDAACEHDWSVSAHCDDAFRDRARPTILPDENAELVA